MHVHSGNLFGGVETILTTLARYQYVTPQMNWHFAICFEGFLSESLRTLGVPVHSIGSVRLRNPWSIHRARKNLHTLLSRNSFDVAIVHGSWAQILFGKVIQSHSLRLVLWVHDTPTGKSLLEKIARSVKPDLLLTNSEYTDAAAAPLFPGVARNKFHCPVPPSTVDDPASVRRRMRRTLNVSDDTVVVTQVSRMEPYKGAHVLIQALAKLRCNRKWVAWIVGGAQRESEKSYAKELERLAISLGIQSQIFMLGQRKDVSDLLAASDIHCQANISGEPFGIIFIEALSAGLPVITSDCGGAREIITDGCGLLVPPGDSTRLSAAISNLVENPMLRKEMGARGPARAKLLCDPGAQLTQLQSILFHDADLKVAL